MLLLQNKYLTLTAFFLRFLLIIPLSFAQNSQIIIFENPEEALTIGKSIEFLEDKEGQLKIEDILATTNQNKFQKNTQNIFAQPATESVFWLKIILKNSSKKDILLEIGSTFIWYIDFYAPDSLGNYTLHTKTGSLRPKKNKKHKVNWFWLPLNKASETESKTYYLRVSSGMVMEVPLSIGTVESLYAKKSNYDYLLAGFVSIMLIVFFYNTFLYFHTKDQLYLYYLGYVLGATINFTFLNGYQFMSWLTIGWLSNFWWQEHFLTCNFLFPAFSGLFAIQYLKLKSQLKWAYWLILIHTILLAVIFPILNLFIGLVYLVGIYQFLILSLGVFCFTSSIIVWIHHQKSALFYSLGWGAILIAGFIFTATINGILPYNIFTRNAMYFGVSIEVLFFSIALAYRINLLIKEKEFFVKKQKELLENEVEKRTFTIAQQKELLTQNEFQLRNNLEEIIQIQEELVYNNQKLETALEHNTAITKALDKSAMVSITDLEGNIIKVNNIFCEVSKYSRKELIGQNQHIVNSGHHPKEFWEEMWKVIGTGNTWRAEVKNKDKNGNTYWVDAVMTPMYNSKGNIYQYFSVSYIITDKKKAAKEIKKLALIAQETHNVVVVTDKDEITEWVNDSFITNTGYTLEDLKGKKPGQILQGEATDPAHIQGMRDGVASKKPFNQEILNYSKDGIPYWIESQITPIFDETGEVEKFVAIQRNITQEKKLSEELKSINFNLISSIEYAKEIQNTFLPPIEEIEKSFPNSFIYFKPLNIVSGDFYFHTKKRNKSIIAAIDCTGHGIPGAFMSLISYQILNDIINFRGVTEVDTILNLLRAKLIDTLKQEQNEKQDGMEIGICMIDKEKQYLDYAGSKNDLLYFQEGKMNILEGDKIIIGGVHEYFENSYFSKQTISLEKPITFYLFSDGIKDQFGGKRKRKFTLKRLKKTLFEIHQKDMSCQKQIFEEKMANWMENTQQEQTDDMLLIGVHI